MKIKREYAPPEVRYNFQSAFFVAVAVTFAQQNFEETLSIPRRFCDSHFLAPLASPQISHH